MSKTRDTGFLGNVVKVDSNGDISLMHGSTMLMQISSSGAVTVTGVISGSNALTSSYSQNSELLDNLDSTSFVFTSSYNTDSSSFSTRTTNLETASGSFSTRVTRIEGNYATTGSNVFLGAQTVCANITSTGTIIAQTLNVQQVTSSIVYSSGSNVFGCSLSNTQQFTGSVTMTGSLNVAGNTCVTSICSPAYVGGTVSGTTVYGSTAICGGVVCGTSATFSSTLTANGTGIGLATFGGSASGLVNSLILNNTSNTANSDAVLTAKVAGASGGNPHSRYEISGVTTWFAGVNNASSDAYVIAGDAGIGSGTYFSMALNGAATFACTVTTSNASVSATYGSLTVGGTGISIADDGNAKLQIGRFNSANCNAYIKMGINTCSLRFTNPGDTVDVVTFDKGGSVLIGTTATPVGKLDIATGGNTNVVISNDSTDTGYNIISLNGTRTKGSYAGIAGGGTGDNRLYLNSGVEVVIQTGASYVARMRTYATGPTCFSCPVSITGAGSGTALNFGNTVANNILYINSYGGWSGIGMDATSATMRIAGDITEPNGIVQFGYYKGGTLNNACWCQKAVILTTGIGCFANTVCAPTFRGGSSLQLGGYAFQFTAAKNFNENTSDVEFFKIAMGGGQAAIFVNFSSYNSGTAAYKMQTYHGLLSNNWTGWVGCGIEVTGNPSCRANFAASSINSIATYSGCLVFRVSTTNNGTSTQATGTANILVVTDGTVPTFTQL